VKLWDLHSFGQENLVYTYSKHSYSPEAVRFIDEDIILSASKDQSIHLIDLEGNQRDVIKHSESYNGLAVLKAGGQGYFVASDVKSNIMLYQYDSKLK
jgi:WD40 repeat protein